MSCILRLGGPPIGLRTAISVFPAVKESNFRGHCGGVSPFHELSVHVCHCGVSIVMSLEVLFFKWGHGGITGSFLAGLGIGFCWVERSSSNDSWGVIGGRTWRVGTDGRDAV